MKRWSFKRNRKQLYHHLDEAEKRTAGWLREYLDGVGDGPLFQEARDTAEAHSAGGGEVVEAGMGAGFGGLPKGTKVYVRADGSFTVLWTRESMARFQAETIIGMYRDVIQQPLTGWTVDALTKRCSEILEHANSSPEAFAAYKRGTQEQGMGYWLNNKEVPVRMPKLSFGKVGGVVGPIFTPAS